MHKLRKDESVIIYREVQRFLFRMKHYIVHL